MKIPEDKFLKKNIQIWLFGILLMPVIAFWDVMFIKSNEILSIYDFMGIILFGPVLIFSLSTPFWFLFNFINRFLFQKIKNEWLLNIWINLVSIIFGLMILGSVFYLDEDIELNKLSFLMIFLQIMLITFFTWVIKVERGYVKVAKKKTGSSRSDILDDDLDS